MKYIPLKVANLFLNMYERELKCLKDEYLKRNWKKRYDLEEFINDNLEFGFPIKFEDNSTTIKTSTKKIISFPNLKELASRTLIVKHLI